MREELDKILANAMKLEEFEIGKSFIMSGKEWLCVDIGTWCVIAVKLGPRQMTQTTIIDGKRTIKNVTFDLTADKVEGPPYSTWGPQVIIPEEFPACKPTKESDDVSR